MFKPVLLLVLDRCAPDGPPILAKQAPPPEHGHLYHEVETVFERDPQSSSGVRIVSKTDTGRRFVYVDKVSPDLYDTDPAVKAETDAMRVVTAPDDFTMHRLRAV